jgi:hypothetical protein
MEPSGRNQVPTGGKWGGLNNRSGQPFRNRWQPHGNGFGAQGKKGSTETRAHIQTNSHFSLRRLDPLKTPSEGV